MKYEFIGKDLGNMTLKIDGVMEKVELLHLFEFDSDRKRMSVIIKHNGVIKLYTKGADSIIKARLSK